MNNKISQQELAASFAVRKELPKKQAELFVRTMFEIVQEYVVKEGVVKVKGLGTFKLINVESRASVDVSTGERIQIDSHSKITFTPDKALADQVNKPFAGFTTVILNPDTKLEDMESMELDELLLPELTPEELAERDRLRRIYIDSVKASLVGHLENTYIVEPDGTKKKLGKKN